MSELKELFPKDFETRVKSDSFLGNDLLLALNQEKPTSIRINPLKYKNNLTGTTKIPWSTNGFWLNERPQFTLDPHFHAGAYYPQEAGSQFLDAVLRQLDLPESPIVLDLCAAPGGKSTLIADFLNEKGLLVSNEIHSGRAKILKENLTKWGKSNTLVSNNSPSDFESIDSFFDLIVVDAPCSGEGMFRKDLNARNEWSEANVEMCSLRQKEILSSCWDSLKPNGFLVYSTCTFNSTENEQIIEWMTQEFDCSIYPIDLENAHKGRNSIGYYALPHLIDTEGFYICVLQKNYQQKNSKKQKYKKSELSPLANSEVKDFIDFNSNLSFVKWREYAFAVPLEFSEEIFYLHSKLRLQKMGVEIGEISRKGIIPNEALAFSSIININIQRIELTKNEALNYLKGETFSLEGKQGWALLTYEGNALGWIKHLGNRFNNLFPKEWRIRMKID